MHEVVLALAERGPFLREHADDCIGVSTHANDFADRRFVREQSFLDDLSNDNHAPRKLDVFIIQIAAITKRVSIRGEKTFIGSHNKKIRRCLYAVINRLTFHFVTKTFQANLASFAFHQPVIMQRLFICDVVPVAKFLLRVAARTDIGRIFAKLKNVGPEKANTVLNRVLQRADRGHD